MTKNREIFESLFKENIINIKKGKIFDIPVKPKNDNFDFDKIEGMLLGVAIGDSLGITTEGMSPKKRIEIYGDVTDYLPNRYTGLKKGYPSDDTQLTFWTLEQLIDDNGFYPEKVAEKFCKNRIFGIGSTVKRFIKNYKAGIDWRLCAPKSAGNGSLMRISPIILPYLKNGGTDLWIDTALLSIITYNDSLAISSCIAFVYMLWELLDMNKPSEKFWYLETYLKIVRDLDIGNKYSPRGGKFKNYIDYFPNYIEKVIKWADSNNLSTLEACNSWYSGAYLLETVPSVIYIMMKHGDNFEKAVIRAVTDTKDNDTIGSIVGALAGALHGKKSIPKKWIDNLTGRLSLNDDNKIFPLINESKLKFWG